MAFHGIRVNEEDNTVHSVTDAASGIPFVVGTCPVHLAESGEVSKHPGTDPQHGRGEEKAGL